WRSRGPRQLCHRRDVRPRRRGPARARAGAFHRDLHDQWTCPPVDPGHHGARVGARMSYRRVWRKCVNGLMLGLTGLCTVVTVSVLFFILGYLVWHGGRALTWAFITRLPKPVGEGGE